VFVIKSPGNMPTTFDKRVFLEQRKSIIFTIHPPFLRL